MYWTIVSNAVPLMIASMFEMVIENINMHYATNKQMMAGIGMATILVHCVGGSLILGFRMGFVGFASRTFGADNKTKYRQTFVQALTNLAIILSLFAVLAFGSYQIVRITGQSEAIAQYSYRTMISHLPGFCLYYMSDFLWGFLNSQKVFRPVIIIFLAGLSIHLALSMTISKAYGFTGIIISTNVTFATMFVITLFVAYKYSPWQLSLELLDVEEPFCEYKNFVKQCFLIAIPFTLNLFVFQLMTLYLGSYKMNSQTAANVALTNLDGMMIAPHLGYSIFTFTKIGHFIGENQPEKIKSIIKHTIILSIITYYGVIILVLIFRYKLAEYYFTDKDVYKYFFTVLNLFLLRGGIHIIKAIATFVFRAFGMGSQLVKICIFCYYGVSVISMVAYCRYLEEKVLGVWLGFFTGEVVMALIFLYMMQDFNIDKMTQQLNQKVTAKTEQNQISPID